jgi:hypothetical protein
MASENVHLLAFAIVLFTVNALLGGPLAAGIARFFGRISSRKTANGTATKYSKPKADEAVSVGQPADRALTSRRAA